MSWKTYHRWQAFILFGWGLFILDKITDGNILFYINRRYVLLALAAAVTFMALGQVVLSAALRRKEPGEVEHVDAHEHGGRPAAWGLVILAAPLLLGLVIPARPLGATAVSTRGINAAAPLGRLSTSAISQVNVPSTERSVLDWVSNFNSATAPATYQGQAARVIGFVYHDPRLDKKQFVVSRFIVTCCVADAVALGMVVDWPDAASLEENSWVEVQGSITTVTLNDQPTPGIVASAVNPVAAPDQPYLFP